MHWTSAGGECFQLIFISGETVVKHLVIFQWTNFHRECFRNDALVISVPMSILLRFIECREFMILLWECTLVIAYCKNTFFSVLPQFEGTPVIWILVVKYNIQGEWHLVFLPIFRNPLVLMCRLYLQIYVSFIPSYSFSVARTKEETKICPSSSSLFAV